MRAFEIIIESSGGLARRWIEKQTGKDIFFLDSNKTKWDLEDVQFFPADPDLAYLTDETGTAQSKLKLDLDQYLKSKSLNTIKTFGEKSANAKSLASIVVIVSDGKNRIAYNRQVSKKKTTGPNPILWDNTEFQTNTGLTVQTPQMKKAGIKIEPADLLIPNSKYKVRQLVDTVTKNLNNANLPEELKIGIPQILQNVVQGKTTAVPKTKEHEPVIQIKFGEIAAPIALTTGNLVTGSYSQADEKLCGPLGGSWRTATAISFPDKGETLVDSYVHLPGGQIGVSSKAGDTGAKPSVKSIIETLDQKPESFSPEFINENQNLIENLRIVYSETSIDGIQKLARKFKIIDDTDLKYIESIYSKGKVDPVGITENLKNLLSKSSYQKVEKEHPEYQLGYHILAVLARYVADNFNQDRPAITEFFKAVLNNSNMVQIKARTATQGDGVAFSAFEVIWPPVFGGSIVTYAGHFTSRTRPTRKLSFEFK